MARSVLLAALAGFALLGATEARAQYVLDTSPSFSFDGWSVSITGCSYTPRGGSSGSCSGSQIVTPSLLATGALDLVYSGSSGGSLLPSGAASLTSDMSFMENITAPSGELMNSIKVQVAGTASSTPSLAFDTVGAQLTSPPADAQTVNANATPMDATINLTTLANTVAITKDLSSGSISLTGTLSLDSVSQTFSVAVPEPASLSLVAVGFIGLLAFRRRAVSST